MSSVSDTMSNPFRPEDKWSIADDAGDAVVVTSLVHTRHDCHYATTVRVKNGDLYRFARLEGYNPTLERATHWHEFALSKVRLELAREDLRAFAAKKERRCWQIRGLHHGYKVLSLPTWTSLSIKGKTWWIKSWTTVLKESLRSLQRKRRQATPATRRNYV